MSKISYVQYLREVYPGKSQYQNMLPVGDPAGDNYGDIHIPGRASISGYRATVCWDSGDLPRSTMSPKDRTVWKRLSTESARTTPARSQTFLTQASMEGIR